MLYQIDKSLKPPQLELELALPSRIVIGNLTEVYGRNYTFELGTTNELKFTIPRYVRRKHENIENKNFHNIRERYVIHAEFNGQSEWLLITNITTSKKNVDIKHITAQSLQVELNDKRIRGYEKISINPEEAMSDALQYTLWGVGEIDSELLDTYRAFEESKTTSLNLLYKIAEKYNAILVFDTEKRLVHLRRLESIKRDRGLTVSHGKFMKSVENQSNAESGEIITRLYIYGKDDITINSVNPSGTNYLEDFSYFMQGYVTDDNGSVISSSPYMSDGLCQAIIDYDSLLEEKSGQFQQFLADKEPLQQEMVTLKSDLMQLQIDLLLIQDQIDIAKAAGDDYTQMLEERNAKEIEIAGKQVEVDSLQTQIDAIDHEIALLRNAISIENNFTPEQIQERNMYIIEDEWTDRNYFEAKDLYEEGKRKLSSLREPKRDITLDIVQFLAVVDEQRNWDKIGLGYVLHAYYSPAQVDFSSIITEMDINFDNHTIKLKFSNIKHKSDMRSIAEKLYETAMGTSNKVDMNSLKWDESANKTTQMEEILNNTWDAAERRITAGVNESVEVSRSGVVVRNPDFPDQLIVMQSGILALSEDGGENWKTAITPSHIVAERILGRMIAGTNLVIENESGTFKLDENGAEFDIDSFIVRSADENLVDRWNNAVTQAQLELTSQELSIAFSKSTGLNLLQNSIGFAGTNFWSVEGEVEIVQNQEVEANAGGSAFQISENSKLTQTAFARSGNTYTFSSLIKKGLDANGYIRIYDGDVSSQIYEEIILDGMEYDYERVIQSITPSNNTITIEFYCSMGDILLTDNMLNSGDVAINWQLATGELYNTNIQMDLDGIRVSRHEDGNVVGRTVMTPERFAGYFDVDQDGEIDESKNSPDEVFRMDQDEFVMKKSVAKEEITMGSIKIVKVDSTKYTGWAFVPIVEEI